MLPLIGPGRSTVSMLSVIRANVVVGGHISDSRRSEKIPREEARNYPRSV